MNPWVSSATEWLTPAADSLDKLGTNPSTSSGPSPQALPERPRANESHNAGRTMSGGSRRAHDDDPLVSEPEVD
jgi:hypothetical protein